MSETKDMMDTLYHHSITECGIQRERYISGNENSYAVRTRPFAMADKSVLLDEVHLLPAVPAIYFAVSGKTGLLYIGRAKNLHHRWQGHHQIVQLRRYGDVCISWISFPGLEASHLPTLEAAYIDHFLPPLNQTSDNRYAQKRESFNTYCEAPGDDMQEVKDPSRSYGVISVPRDSEFLSYLKSKAIDTGIKPTDQILLYAMAHVDMIKGKAS